MKLVFYFLFAAMFYLYSVFPVNKRKVLFIMTHDKDLTGNIGAMLTNIKQKAEFNKYIFITREDYRFNSFPRSFFICTRFFLLKSFHMATAQSIFMDNIFLPLSLIKTKKGVHVVQLWHGCGAIKKFGQDYNDGLLAKLEKLANKHTSHFILNSESAVSSYSSAFSIPKSKIYTVGSPRTDFFLDSGYINKIKEGLKNKLPNLAGKKAILYAPTFRDHDVDNPKIPVNIDFITEHLRDNYVFIIKLHPHIISKFSGLTKSDNLLIVDSTVSLNELLILSDILVTDYSSIIFEYSLLEKPMIFFPYDYDFYIQNGRGFYYDYSEFVPGPIASNEHELVNIIRNEQYEKKRSVEFKLKHFDFLDGQSSDRVYDLLYNS
ncbi:CDP-glycerol glycerophosphotransferase family protein [Paenibacillus sp. Y412MC10]|uniref:CDP-glycerol glycerophosphotransferase family protein n=1 Tax=Geobacillus sp. (strain Y412MC10) TaxID=481743 RepID=UPI0011AAF5D9|nr:CDP-glycerol glycerophosphotransferase family protein [Paenibacillus sp. Y412MC10]